MADAAERMRKMRARKAREKEALERARANVLPPLQVTWDEKAKRAVAAPGV